jgi:16S rRNA (guanine527-N7)-methyltransferase
MPASDATLATTLAHHHIDLPDEVVAQLDRYARALWEWNAKINLTRHTTYDKFVSRDLADSLWLEKFLDAGERVLDVGTGGGVPGVLLAILRPDLEVSLCDSVAKKARVVASIVEELKLPIRVHHAAAQDVLQNHHFDTLVVRAVAPLAKLLTWVNPHWDAFHQLLVIRQKGLMNELSLRKLAAYPLPGTESESVLLAIRPRTNE